MFDKEKGLEKRMKLCFSIIFGVNIQIYLDLKWIDWISNTISEVHKCTTTFIKIFLIHFKSNQTK